MPCRVTPSEYKAWECTAEDLALVGIPNLLKILKVLCCFIKAPPLLVCSAGKQPSTPTTLAQLGIKLKTPYNCCWYDCRTLLTVDTNNGYHFIKEKKTQGYEQEDENFLFE